MRVMDEATGEGWQLFNGDSAEVLKGLPDQSIHLSVFSPPFSSLYTYTPSERDIGNVATHEEFFEHFGYVSRELLRIMVPGRTVAVHTYDLQLFEGTHGRRARYDFPGDVIRHMEGIGFNFMARITIDKNPQVAAIRNHPVELLFATLRKDASKCAPAQADYLLLFHAPGDNPVPVPQPCTEEEWIQWAAPVWKDIRETDVLSLTGSRDNDDERHLCPLQLPVIERCVRLWTNPGETVLDPFSGIGSTGYEALRHGRRYVGIELKPSYFKVAARFLREAEQLKPQRSMFDFEAVS